MPTLRASLRRLLGDFFTACWQVVRLPFRLINFGFRDIFSLGVRKIMLLVAAVVVVTIVTTLVFIKATSQPGFCVSCHVMQPYFDAWAVSSHSKISCTTCHVPPGLESTLKHKFMALSMIANYLTGVYKRSKPWAEIDDAACLREGCHDTRLLRGREEFKGVVFDHQPHLNQERRDRRLRCTSCHAQIVQGAHITVTEGTCFLCHFKPDSVGQPTDLATCTHCHQPPTGTAAADTAFDHTEVLQRQVACSNCHASAVAGDGFVSPERCNSCHAKQEHIQRYGDLVFVHETHVTEHKVECLSCHIAIRHGRDVAPTMDPSKHCNACHGLPDDATSAVWKGELPGLPKTASAMAMVGMTCASCHPEPIHLGKGEFRPPECTPCHAVEYDRLWRTWKEPLRTTLQRLEAMTRTLAEPGRSQLRAALDVYRRGNPIHNPDLIKVLEERIARSSSAESAGACSRCHPAARDQAPVWNGKVVEHRVHAQNGVACERCHDPGQVTHGRLQVSAAQCNECHHQRAASGTSCETCHPTQANVYSGKVPEVTDAAPSVMSSAEVACTDCHALQGNRVRRHDAGTCVNCHSNEYADTLQAWLNQGEALLARASAVLNHSRPGSELHDSYARFIDALRRDGSLTAHHPRLFSDWIRRIEESP